MLIRGLRSTTTRRCCYRALSTITKPIVFLDIEIDKLPMGRIVLELRSGIYQVLSTILDIAPKTAENFRQLCTGEAGIGTFGKPLSYKNTYFHRVFQDFMIQGGDNVNFDGTGGESIYGEFFDNENYELPHNNVGLLAMAHKGVNTQGSQFYITTQPCDWLNGSYTVFGSVLDGLKVCYEIGYHGTDTGKPLVDIKISDCGQLDTFDISNRKDDEPPPKRPWFAFR